MPALKLEKLPDSEPVRMTVMLSPELNRTLAAYARAYEEIYGAPASVQSLIPAMLERFVRSDRAFVRRRKNGEMI